MPLSASLSVGDPLSPLCDRHAVIISPRLAFSLLSAELSRQTFVQQTCSFLAFKLFPESSQSAVLRQSHFQVIQCFPRLQGSHLQFVVQFLITDADLFLIRNAVQQDGGFYLCNRAISLCSPQPVEVQFAHLVGLHALCRQ